jgi:Arc/MetJ family transcription regulator
MRTVTELDEKLLREAMTVTGVTKRRQLLEIALQEMIRHRRIERLRQRLGKTQLTMTPEELQWMRADG